MELNIEGLPRAVNELHSDIREIKAILKSCKPEPDKKPNVMQSREAIEYLQGKGIPMSKSRIYKLVMSKSDSGLPVHRVDSRLLFYADELDQWCESKINNQNEFDQTSLIKSAKRKK